MSPFYIKPLTFISFCLSCLFWFSNAQALANSPEESRVVLWVDPSFSSSLARHMLPPHSALMAKEVEKFEYPLYGLAQNIVFEQGQLGVEVTLEALPNAQAAVHFLIKQMSQPPSPFLSSVPVEEIRTALQKAFHKDAQKNILIVLSDGHAPSLSAWVELRDMFVSGLLLKHQRLLDSPSDVQEVAPVWLGRAWQSGALPSKSDFMVLDSSLANNIPSFARPQWYLKKYMSRYGDFSFISENFTDAKTLLPEHELSQPFPFTFLCTQNSSYFSSFNPWLRLRKIVQNQNGVVYERPCSPVRTGQSWSTVQTLYEEAWFFRPSTLWVVPLDEDILATLYGRRQLWYPQGFDVEVDALAYIPSPSTLASPLLPSFELSFSDQKGKPLYQARFRAFFNEKETPLGWKTDTLPFYYWRGQGLDSYEQNLKAFLNVASQALDNKQSSGFKSLRPQDVRYKDQLLERLGLNVKDVLGEYLNPETLSFEPVTSGFALKLGLYRTSQSKSFVLLSQDPYVSYPLLNAQDFASYFSLPPENFQKKQSVESTVFKFLHWLKELVLGAQAQGQTVSVLPSQSAVTFGWCAERISERVQKNYDALQQSTPIKKRNLLKNTKLTSLEFCAAAKGQTPWQSVDFLWLRGEDVEKNLPTLQKHVNLGGFFLVESASKSILNVDFWSGLTDVPNGLVWRTPLDFYRLGNPLYGLFDVVAPLKSGGQSWAEDGLLFVWQKPNQRAFLQGVVSSRAFLDTSGEVPTEDIARLMDQFFAGMSPRLEQGLPAIK